MATDTIFEYEFQLPLILFTLMGFGAGWAGGYWWTAAILAVGAQPLLIRGVYERWRERHRALALQYLAWNEFLVCGVTGLAFAGGAALR